MSTDTQQVRGFSTTRLLAAPPGTVFRAWTDPAQLRWFGTDLTPADSISVDLRVGGAWRLLMVESPDRSYVTGGIYREISAPDRLVFSFGAPDGWPPIDLARPDDGPVVTLTFAAVDGGTEMTLSMAFADSVPDEDVARWLALGMADGWRQTLDRLAPAVEGTG